MIIESSLVGIELVDRELLEGVHVPPDWIDAAFVIGAGTPEQDELQRRVAIAARQLPTDGPSRLRFHDDPLDVQAFVIAAARQFIAFARSCPVREPSGLINGDDGRSRSDVLRVRNGYLPLLRALGMWEFKRLLDDAAFKFDAVARHDNNGRAAAPGDRFDLLAQAFDEFRELQRPFVEHVVRTASTQLHEAGLEAEVEARFCGVSGARRRLLAMGGGQSFTSNRPGEFFSLHLRMGEASACYAAIAVVHQIGLPSPASFTDRIATPKPNGYSGLFSRIAVGWGATETGWTLAEPLQVVIQTAEMDDVARFGVLAPVCNDIVSGDRESPLFFAERLLNNIGMIELATQEDVTEVATMTVFSSGGRSSKHTPRTIERGATVLDLAYQVHSRVGDRAQTARVNGKEVELGYPLVEGEVVEIILAAGKESVRREGRLEARHNEDRPEEVRAALNANEEIKGRHAIVMYLERKGIVFGGRDALDVAVRAVSEQFRSVEPKTPEAIYRAVADENQPVMTGGAVGARIAMLEDVAGYAAAQYAPNTPMAEWRPALADDVTGLNQGAIQHFKICKFCQPGPSHASVGVVSRRGDVTVHRAVCRYTHKATVVPLEWVRQGRPVSSTLTLYCDDRPLLVHGICEVLYRRGCGLERIEAEVGELGTARVVLNVYTGGPVALGDLMEAFRRHPSVRNVRLDSTSLPDDDRRKVASGDWPALRAEFERDNRWHRENAAPVVLVEPSFNADRSFGDIVLPYNEQKLAYTPELFYGRAVEKQRLLDRTSQGSGSYIFVAGPRRVGKSSLAIRFADGVPTSHSPLIVRLDLRREVETASESILRRIAAALATATGDAIGGDDPEAAITRIVDRCEAPVVLVLDEFGGPLKSYINGTLGTVLFDWMRRTLEREEEALRRLSVVLVAPPDGLHVIRQPALAQYFDRILTFRVGPLAHLDTVRMITTPYRQQGISIDNVVADEIARITGGHPYFVIALLRKITEHLNQKRGKTEITMDDVGRCARRLYLDRSYFEPMLLEVAPDTETKVRLHAVAQHVEDDLVPVAKIVELVGAHNDRLGLVATLSRAAEYGVLRRHLVHDQQSAFAFRVPLFRRWLADQDLEMLVVPRSALLR